MNEALHTQILWLRRYRLSVEAYGCTGGLHVFLKQAKGETECEK